jgi:peptidoglycan lytic transglycosylase
MAYRSEGGRGPLHSTKPAPGMLSRVLRQFVRLLALWLFAFLIGGCTTAAVAYAPKPVATPVVYAQPVRPAPAKEESQIIVANASWYGPGFEGHKTATGERFSSRKMTAAAKDLPLGSRVVVTNLSNGRSATVRINDCGPYWKNRKLDLSKRAARKLGLVHDGIAKVKVKVIKKPADAPTCPSSI